MSNSRLFATDFKELTTVTGDACFVCETDQDLGDIVSMTTSDCPRCSLTVMLDLVTERVGGVGEGVE